MAEKKYFWLKLQKDFFKRHDIRIIEAMPNGKDYILFYLKLLVESVSHEGQLRFSDTIPYSDEMLATITDTNVDIVRSALKVFSQLEMIDVLDDSTIFMNEVEKMISAETDAYSREQGRIRQQRHRDKLKGIAESEKALRNVTVTLNRNAEIEKEKEIDIELEKEVEVKASIDYQKIIATFNTICKSYPRVQSLSDARKKAIKARLATYTEEDLYRAFQKAEESNFLKGANNRNWQANFDWLMKDTSMAKVLDGNYDNKASTTTASAGINWDLV